MYTCLFFYFFFGTQKYSWRPSLLPETGFISTADAAEDARLLESRCGPSGAIRAAFGSVSLGLGGLASMFFFFQFLWSKKGFVAGLAVFLLIFKSFHLDNIYYNKGCQFRLIWRVGQCLPRLWQCLCVVFIHIWLSF